MSSNEKKIAEGQECWREADKCLKTGLFKWKPDYEGAASEYGKAAVAFKNGKALDQATASYLKQADMLEKSGSNFHAAKAYESAAMLQKDSGDLGRAADLIEKAADMFLEHGTPSSAAVMLDRAGKMLENSLPDRSIKLYIRACDVSEAEDRVKECAEMIGKAARVLIRTKRLEEAGVCVTREIDYYNKAGCTDVLSKLVMGLTLINLHLGDYVAADKAFQDCLRKCGDFQRTDEASSIEQLLDAYDQCDQEKAEQIAKSPLFKFMENDFTKLARDLRVPEGLKAAPASNSTQQTSLTISAVGGELADGEGGAGEEDSEEGGLC